MKVLVINCGSSSLKYELFETQPEQSLASGICERVGVGDGADALLHHRPAGGPEIEKRHPMSDHAAAFAVMVDALTDPTHGVISRLEDIDAVGHRVVHGGEHFSQSVLIDDQVIAAIEQCAELAPLHNPANLTGIRAAMQHLPHVPHVAVFDTAFHQTMPRRAWLYGLPYDVYERYGVRRYGFHGTSHRYVAGVAAEVLAARGIPRERQRVVTCHLGNGCSVAAVLGGQSIDTSMGFTPLEGLLMGTRCGDIDPAVVPYLMERLGLDPDGIDELMNKRSGLLGVSGVSNDMRDVQKAAAEGNDRARAAVELFCYRVRKYIGAYAAAMGGIDAVVFTAGIGENDPLVRSKSLEGLEFLGLAIDEAKNQRPDFASGAADISTADAAARVLVIPTDEELMIARDTAALVANG